MPVKYSIFKDVPVEQIALLSDAISRNGFHYHFEDLKDIPNLTRFPFPEPKRTGVTFRVFVYFATIRGWTEIKMLYDDSYFTSARVAYNGLVDAPTSGVRTSARTINSPYTVREGQFFSLALRMENRYLKAYYNKLEYHVQNVGTNLTVTYYLDIKNIGNKLLSAHIYNEFNPDESWFGDAVFWNLQLPEHTTLVYTIRTYGSPPADLYLVMPGARTNEVYFSLPQARMRNVKAGDTFVFTIRISRDGYLISNDFHPTKRVVFNAKGTQTYLSIKFENRMDIIKVEAIVPPYRI